LPIVARAEPVLALKQGMIRLSAKIIRLAEISYRIHTKFIQFIYIIEVH
jgi:hypothetical protein